VSWNVTSSPEFDQWFDSLSTKEQKRIVAGVEALKLAGPGLGRPIVDTLKGSKHPNMKELRRGTLRVLFAFDAEQTAVLLVGGDKRGNWRTWYQTAIAQADKMFDEHLGRLRKGKSKRK
jgi:hypothetical protein